MYWAAVHAIARRAVGAVGVASRKVAPVTFGALVWLLRTRT